VLTPRSKSPANCRKTQFRNLTYMRRPRFSKNCRGTGKERKGKSNEVSHCTIFSILLYKMLLHNKSASSVDTKLMRTVRLELAVGMETRAGVSIWKDAPTMSLLYCSVPQRPGEYSNRVRMSETQGTLKLRSLKHAN
jgi:hypothetical protein